MNYPLFLYNFVKVYVPGALLLCIIYVVTSQIPKQNTGGQIQPQMNALVQQVVSPKLVPPTKAKVGQSVPEPATPRYAYLIELSSGGSMKAKSYNVKENLVKIIIDDGYEVTMSKKDIRSIKRIKL